MYIIFDKYSDKSIKAAERIRHGSSSSLQAKIQSGVMAIT